MPDVLDWGSPDGPAPGEKQPRSAGWRRPLIAALAGGGLLLGVAGVAAAADGSSGSPSPGSTGSPTPSTAATPDTHKDGRKLGKGFGHGPGRGMGHGLGMGRGLGLGRSLHGEFVVPGENGGYRTVLTQSGQVTAVDSSSVTVKSDDGYTKTYSVPADALVNAQRGGLGSVKTGHVVRVLATVTNGGKATAVTVADVTLWKETRRELRPGPRSTSGSTAQGTTDTSTDDTVEDSAAALAWT